MIKHATPFYEKSKCLCFKKCCKNLKFVSRILLQDILTVSDTDIKRTISPTSLVFGSDHLKSETSNPRWNSSDIPFKYPCLVLKHLLSVSDSECHYGGWWPHVAPVTL